MGQRSIPAAATLAAATLAATAAYACAPEDLVPTPDDPEALTWTEWEPFPEERTEVSVTTDGERIFLAGGFGPPEEEGQRASAPRALWVFDPVQRVWSSPTEIPEGVHHAGFTHLDGRLYLVGGFRETGFEPVGHVWIYDLESEEWSEGEPMPTPRGAGALAVLDGRIHWIGGNAEEGDHLHEPEHGDVAGDQSTGTHEAYDPETDSWARLAPMPTARNHHGAAALGGRIHVLAGRVERDFELTVHEVYDPATDAWTSGAEVPTGRSGIAVVTLDDRIYVFGGETFAQPSRTFDEAERLSPATEEWQALAPMPTARHGLGAAALRGRIHVVSGGPGPGFTYSGAHEVLEAMPPP